MKPFEASSQNLNEASEREIVLGGGETAAEYDLVCFSHLRWDFVYQRPQHLLSRCAGARRVFFVEEPVVTDDPSMRMETSEREGGVTVVVPRVPAMLVDGELDLVLRALVDDLLDAHHVADYVVWYYTPMALGFTRHLAPRAIVYDCMDELSAFKGASPELVSREAELFGRADLVFTGGQSLYEAKRDKHPSVHAFPSSIDAAHFGQAREEMTDPEDQREIAHPRLGFFGVVDERFDVDLLAGAADLRPEWQFVVIGPVVKIDPNDLPRRPNVHYLGGKSYAELPAYLANWDVATMPFARNESTRFISPTKTPEYLAAGKPVVSTSIRDVVRPYADLALVHIADTPEEFVAAAEAALAGANDEWLGRVDEFLANTSWDRTWGAMSALIDGAVGGRKERALAASAGAAAATTTATTNTTSGATRQTIDG